MRGWGSLVPRMARVAGAEVGAKRAATPHKGGHKDAENRATNKEKR